MIVVEGPDGSGKTTLCNWICEQFNLMEGERGTENRDELYRVTRYDTWNAMNYELKYPNMKPEVWDRLGPISDPIYSGLALPVKRKCQFTHSEIEAFMAFVHHLGLLILCMPPLDVIRANVGASKQMEGVTDKTDDIYMKYRALTRDNRFFIYDYTLGAPSGIAVLVNRYLLARKERACLSS